MGCSTPGFPALHYLLELAQTHVHWVDDTTQLFWCHPTISSSVDLFSLCLQSFLASESFPMSWCFTSGGPSMGASVSVLPMNIQGWFLLGLTDLISLQSKGLSRIFFSTIISPKFHAAYRKTEATRSQIRYYVVEPEWDSRSIGFQRSCSFHKIDLPP